MSNDNRPIIVQPGSSGGGTSVLAIVAIVALLVIVFLLFIMFVRVGNFSLPPIIQFFQPKQSQPIIVPVPVPQPQPTAKPMTLLLVPLLYASS